MKLKYKVTATADTGYKITQTVIRKDLRYQIGWLVLEAFKHNQNGLHPVSVDIEIVKD